MGPSIARASACLALLVSLAGCAGNPVVNSPLDTSAKKEGSKGRDYTFADWIDSHGTADLNENLIVLSFSGGGLRAAALASSVLEALATEKLDSRIAVISSTSGGSVAAGYFAARGTEGMCHFRTKFLRNDNTSELASRLVPAFVTGENRSTLFADYLDRRLFGVNECEPGKVGTEGAPVTYERLMRRWPASPYVILNASDASSGRSFEFTQPSFGQLCSDLGPLRVSTAMAASAAFPFLMTPVPLQNYWGTEKCKGPAYDVEKYKSVVEKRHLDLQQFVAARHAHALRYSRSVLTEEEKASSDIGYKTSYRTIEYVHLIDGGLADNLAARALIRTFTTDVVDKLRKKGVRRILLIQVNAKTDAARDMDKSDAIPSWVEIFKTVALNPIDVVTELSSFISEEYWVSLIRYVNASTEQGETQAKDILRFYPVQVDFDLLDIHGKEWKENREKQDALRKVATNWSLPEDQVKLVEDVGKSLLASHPCFNTFLWESGDKTDPRPTGCDKIDIKPRYAQVGEPRLPAGVAAPAPRPAATKVKLAADTLFDFGKAMLRPEGKRKLDALVASIRGLKLEVIIAVGHTDRLGTDSSNQRLSERRAEAVKAYLVQKGIEANRIYVEGKGSKQPVTGLHQCDGPRSEAVIECLQPDRRVEIEVVGTTDERRIIDR